jgi:hypothetical protein
MPIPVRTLLDGASGSATGVLPADRLYWDIVAGGIPSENDYEKARGQTNVRPPRGIFAEVPGYTPKYAVNDGAAENADFREQMARMFLQIPNYQTFVNEFNAKPEAQQVAKMLGGTVSSTGASSGGNGYIDFLLQSVQHGYTEKNQVVELLADEHVAYFFGQAAPMFTYAGTLLNTKQDDQAMNMLRLYQEMGRGTKLAQRNTLLSIRYDGVIVSGVMMNLSLSLNAEMETAVPFNFSLLVKQVLQLPNKYAGVVQLSKPFSVAQDGYLPFSQGLGDLGTSSVKVVAAAAFDSTPVPAATPTQPVPAAPNPEIAYSARMASKVLAKNAASISADNASLSAALVSTP